MGFPLTGESLVLPGGVKLRLLSVDPTAGSGVEEKIGTIGLRNNNEVGELWQKTGSTDTAWSRVQQEFNGFPNLTDSTISISDGSLQLTIEPTGDSFGVWVQGQFFVKSAAESVNWSDTEGIHGFYYDSSGTLISSPGIPSDFHTQALVAVVYWDATNKVSLHFTGGNERHGIGMGGTTHEYLHFSFRARYDSGLALTDLDVDVAVITPLSSNAAQLGVANGSIRDEDLLLTVDETNQELAPVAEIPVWYLSGTAWRKKTANTFPFVYGGEEGAPAGRVPYNSNGGSWGWTTVANNGFLLLHLFATNDINTPMMAVQGQAEYGNITAARAGATTELVNLYTIGLPILEFVPIATIIIQTADSYLNPPKARFRSVDADGSEYIDWRGTQLAPATGEALSLHSIAGALHSPSPLVDINTKVSDATLDDASNPRPITFVYRPGGTPGGNVYTDWATLHAAVAAMEGIREIWFDDSLSIGYVTLPVGTWDMTGVRWKGWPKLDCNSSKGWISLADGCLCPNLRWIEGPLYITGNASTGVHAETTLIPYSQESATLQIHNNVTIINVDSGGFFGLMGGDWKVMLSNNSILDWHAIKRGAYNITVYASGGSEVWEEALFDDGVIGVSAHLYPLDLSSRISRVQSLSGDGIVNDNPPLVLSVGELNPYPPSLGTGDLYGKYGEFIRTNSSGGDVTVNLPDAESDWDKPREGRLIGVREVVGGNTTYLAPKTFGASDTVEGSSSPYPVPSGGALWIMSDGISDWRIVKAYDPTAAKLDVAQQWTKSQYSAITTLTSSAGHVAITATDSNVYSHDITEDSQVDNPSGLVAGMRWSVIVEANGTNDLTWDTYYDWGESGAPAFSAMADSEYKILDFLAKSTTQIACAASETYGS